MTSSSSTTYSKGGIVYLVGAGPGDLDLLTLGAKQAIERAQVILYDGLVNQRALEFAPADCQRICVGKRGNGGVWTQSQIDDLLVQCARQHQHVVRLKGGDTGVFARTSEEVERLEAEGIRYKVLPGLTAALAVSAYAGIPLTHRDWSSGIALVAAQLQNQDGESEAEDQLDWEALARFPGTLVLYMSVGSAPAWSHRLIAAGKPSHTPVALVRKCSCPDQEVLECELGDVAQRLSENPLFAPPVISIIGPVVRLGNSSALRVDSRQPEAIVTSPETQATRLGQMLERSGCRATICPAITIEPGRIDQIDQAIDAIEQTDWIVFSSRYGVKYFMDRVFERGMDSRILRNVKLATVGRSTAEALKAYGLRGDWVAGVEPSAKDKLGNAQGAEALLEGWCSLAVDQRVCLVRTPEGKSLLAERLAGVAKQVRSVDAYSQVPVQESQQIDSIRARISESIKLGQKIWVTATSSNIAKSAWRLLGPQADSVRWVAISSAVSEVLKEMGASDVVQADEASYESLCRAIME